MFCIIFNHTLAFKTLLNNLQKGFGLIVRAVNCVENKIKQCVKTWFLSHFKIRMSITKLCSILSFAGCQKQRSLVGFMNCRLELSHTILAASKTDHFGWAWDFSRYSKVVNKLNLKWISINITVYLNKYIKCTMSKIQLWI